MARKYLRGLSYNSTTNGRDIPIFMRIAYEFWGYCINGTSSLTTPGGMPTTPTSGPANFFEGGSVLATGNDGVTSDLGINFTSMSASFNSSMIGKYLTIWSHTDPDSTDNSIYRIINVLNANQLQLAVFSGGTRDITTLKNNLTSRSALNYRVFDPIASAQLAVANGNYWVGTLSGASTVNPGQASSQFQFFLRGGANQFGSMGMVGSPAGTWNGSAFVGATITERTHTTSTFSLTAANVSGHITLMGDKDHFIGHIRSSNTGSGSGIYFYVLVPKRIYTAAQDPNPLTIMVGSNNLTCIAIAESHSTNFAMVGFDGTTRTCQLITKNLVGDGATTSGPSNSLPYTIGPNLNPIIAQQTYIGKIIFSEALISTTSTIGQYSLARARLPHLAFTTSSIPSFHLIGDNGEYIHVGNGVLWPWDGSIMPYNLLPLGT